MSDTRIPVTGYHRAKGAEVFQLARGDKLPEGYRDRPFPGQHPHDAEQGRTEEPVKGKPERPNRL